MRGITPTPCNGALYAGLTAEEQITKLTEEFAEAVIAFRNYKRNLQEAKEGEARVGGVIDLQTNTPREKRHVLLFAKGENTK